MSAAAFDEATHFSSLLPRQPGTGVTNYLRFPYNNLRSVWVAVFVLVLIWHVAWLIEIFWKLFVRRLEAPPPPRAGQLQPPEPYKPTWGEKLANASRIIRDSFALLFAAIVISQVSIGVPGYTLGLLWAVWAVLVFWTLVKLVTDNA
ncbi:hypothetical protein DFJ74DRAFT_51853 [Hyaloraphidium curvatum]|nr:hypothetical protein DFJ74DRAFT_51853 [Hyaloraphidium curvatum]